MTGTQAAKMKKIAVPIEELRNPKLKQVALRVAHTMQLAAERAAAHHNNPGKFPIPLRMDSPEQVFLGHIRSMRPAARQEAGRKAIASLTAPATLRRKKFGDLGSLRLDPNTPVTEQVRTLAIPKAQRLTPQDLLDSVNIFPDPGPGGEPDGNGGGPTPGPLPSSVLKLQFRMHNLKCLKETDGEPGADEFAFAATKTEVGTDAAGAVVTGPVEKVDEVKLGDFRTGQSKAFNPPRVLTSFRFGSEVLFPKTFLLTVVAAEKDLGGFAKFMEELVKAISDEVEKQLTEFLGAKAGTAIGAAAGGVIAGIIGAVIGSIVGFVIGLIVDFLVSVFKDDIIAAVSLNLAFPTSDTRFADNQSNSPESTVRFRGGGAIYELEYDWAIVN